MAEEQDIRDRRVGEDGRCVLTGYPCTCIPRTGGHWCCWSIPSEELSQQASEGEKTK